MIASDYSSSSSKNAKASAQIIPFRSNTAGSDEDYFENQSGQFAISETARDWRSIIEASVFEAYIKIKLSEQELIDDPFDAIYISELKRDVISRKDIEKIANFSGIIDLSDTISFNDDWED